MTADEPVLGTTQAPVDPAVELAHKNLLWGWALLGLSLLLFGGTVAVALVYLWLS